MMRVLLSAPLGLHIRLSSRFTCWPEIETIASLPGFGMAPEGHLSYSAGPNMRARRIKPCSVRVRIDPIPLKGLPRLQTCHRQRSSHTGAPTRDKRVHGGGTTHIVPSSSLGP